MTPLRHTETYLKKRQFIEWDQINAEQKMAVLRQETFFMRLQKKFIAFLKPLFQSNQEN